MIFVIVIAVFLLDQSTKLLFTRSLTLGSSLPVVKGLFHFTLVHNRGAAFGMLQGQLLLFIFASVIAIILVFANLRSNKNKKSYNIALSLILGGALGNLVDRLFFGYVIDFLDFRIWPVFNIADSAITIGVVWLGITMLMDKDGKKCSLRSAE